MLRFSAPLKKNTITFPNDPPPPPPTQKTFSSESSKKSTTEDSKGFQGNMDMHVDPRAVTVDCSCGFSSFHRLIRRPR